MPLTHSLNENLTELAVSYTTPPQKTKGEGVWADTPTYEKFTPQGQSQPWAYIVHLKHLSFI
jgi:hypothetical protein